MRQQITVVLDHADVQKLRSGETLMLKVGDEMLHLGYTKSTNTRACRICGAEIDVRGFKKHEKAHKNGKPIRRRRKHGAA